MLELLWWALASPAAAAAEARPDAATPSIELLEFLGEWDEAEQKLIDSMSRAPARSGEAPAPESAPAPPATEAARPGEPG